MSRRALSTIISGLLLAGALLLGVSTRSGMSQNGTIYIKADGSIDPPTPLIAGDGSRYNFTGDISGEIVVQRSNIIIDGGYYTLKGTGTGAGFSMTGISNVTIWRTLIMNFTSGIFLDYSQNNRLTSNIIQNNSIGINLYGFLSTNNTAILNLIHGNDVGVEVNMDSAYNVLHCNTFLDNGIHAKVWGDTSNSWDDDPCGGNYWSNYTGVDINPAPDGIGDTSHTIDSYNVDQRPLMGKVTGTCFEVLVGNEWILMCISVVSNSSAVEYEVFGQGESEITAIGFNVTGPDGTAGFSRVALPHGLLEPPYNVTIDNEPATFATLFENETTSILYITYTHSAHRVVIVPELSTQIILIALLLATLAATALSKRKHNPRGRH